MNNNLEQIITKHNIPTLQSKIQIEAHKCLNCFDAPCSYACPTQINIPKFIKQISDKNIKGAAKTILQDNILGYSCGCACPSNVLCEQACVYHKTYMQPVQIKTLQKYATYVIMNKYNIKNILQCNQNNNSKNIALIGSGPASLSAAIELKLHGYKTTIFEQNKLAGGLLTYGMAPYKITQQEAQKEIQWLSELGIIIKTKIKIINNINTYKNNKYIKYISINTLIKNYDAIFLGLGLGEDSMLSLQKYSLNGIFGAVNLIAQIKSNSIKINFDNIQIAHIIGGGNTAIDIAHELKLLGVKNVIIIYRKNKHNMPAYKFELNQALMHGVHVADHTILTNIIHKNNQLLGIQVKNTKFNKTANFNSNLLVMAIGQNKQLDLYNKQKKIYIDNDNKIIVNPLTGQTNYKKIFAAGDCVNGGKEMVSAIYEAKTTANHMMSYLQ